MEAVLIGNKTLNQILIELGYTTKPARRAWTAYEKQIFDAAGKCVFTGNSVDTWAWLRRTKQIRASPPRK